VSPGLGIQKGNIFFWDGRFGSFCHWVRANDQNSKKDDLDCQVLVLDGRFLVLDQQFKSLAPGGETIQIKKKRSKKSVLDRFIFYLDV